VSTETTHPMDDTEDVSVAELLARAKADREQQLRDEARRKDREGNRR
jgi:hypothetical protein